MRQIGHLADETQARLFGDFLFAQGIRNQVETDSPAGWSIWVHDDDQRDDAVAHLERFRVNPAASEFARAAGSTERGLAQEDQENQVWRRRFFDRQQVFTRQRTYGPGRLTVTLILACVLVSFLSGFGSQTGPIEGLFISESLSKLGGWLPEVRAGQVWRLFTPILIHFGIAHLLFNMLWLFQLGSMIEGLQGSLRLAALIAVIAVGSNLAQYIVVNAGFGGMSGVVYGLFGYIWIKSRFDPLSGYFIDAQSVILMTVWFVLCFTGLVGPIANLAHAGGLAIGAGWGGLSVLSGRHRPR
jgi:GlpG protein